MIKEKWLRTFVERRQIFLGQQASLSSQSGRKLWSTLWSSRWDINLDLQIDSPPPTATRQPITPNSTLRNPPKMLTYVQTPTPKQQCKPNRGTEQWPMVGYQTYLDGQCSTFIWPLDVDDVLLVVCKVDIGNVGVDFVTFEANIDDDLDPSWKMNANVHHMTQNSNVLLLIN